MHVILIKDVPLLGNKDDIKNVAIGYARNFLLSGNLAVIATSAVLKEAEQRKARRTKELETETETIKSLAKKLNGIDIELSAEATEEGTLYAALGFKEIKEALAKKKITIPVAGAESEKPLKSIGDHSVTLHLPHGVDANLTVHIIPEKHGKVS